MALPSPIAVAPAIGLAALRGPDSPLGSLARAPASPGPRRDKQPKDKARRRLTAEPPAAAAAAAAAAASDASGMPDSAEATLLVQALERAAAGAADVTAARAALLALDRLAPGSARLLLDQLLPPASPTCSASASLPPSPPPPSTSPAPELAGTGAAVLLNRWRRSSPAGSAQPLTFAS